MIKKITIGIVFFMLVSVSVYSETVGTGEFRLIAQNLSRAQFNKLFDAYTPHIEFIRSGLLSNSVKKEIDRQLTDYHPLNNGQVFFWQGIVIISSIKGQGELYQVFLRVTDGGKSQWEYCAYVLSFGL
jgi:hypothetical protein